MGPSKLINGFLLPAYPSKGATVSGDDLSVIISYQMFCMAGGGDQAHRETTVKFCGVLSAPFRKSEINSLGHGIDEEIRSMIGPLKFRIFEF